MKTKPCDWLNIKTHEVRYGVKAWVPGRGWLHVSRGGEALMFNTPQERDQYRRRLRRFALGDEVRLVENGCAETTPAQTEPGA